MNKLQNAAGTDSSNPLLEMLDKSEFYPLGKENGSFKIRNTSKGNLMTLSDVMAKRTDIPDPERVKHAVKAGYSPSTYLPVYVHKISGEEISVQDFNSIDDVESKLYYKLKKKPVYTLLDVYDSFYSEAAIAQSLFSDFPKILSVREFNSEHEEHSSHLDMKVEIIDPELFAAINPEEVNSAFFIWTAKQSGIFGLGKKS